MREVPQPLRPDMQLHFKLESTIFHFKAKPSWIIVGMIEGLRIDGGMDACPLIALGLSLSENVWP
jgi:hypothetical protein